MPPARFEKTSISKLDTAEQCLRYYHYQHVLGISDPIPPHRQTVIDKGVAIDNAVEAYMLGKQQAMGAAAAVAPYYPLPGQTGLVDVQRWVRCEWAGAQLNGKVDLIVKPGAKWGRLATPPKSGLLRVTDLKSMRSLDQAKTKEQLDKNRQLFAYVVGMHRPFGEQIPDLVEVSQVAVERDAPYRTKDTVRVVSSSQIEDFEEGDRSLVKLVRASHEVENTLDLPPAPERSSCDRWYGSVCPYKDRCWKQKSISLSDLFDLAEQDGRGGEGTRSALDAVAKKSDLSVLLDIADDAVGQRRQSTVSGPLLPTTVSGGSTDLTEYIAEKAFADVVSSGEVRRFSGVFSFLSNFHASPLQTFVPGWEGLVTFPTAEHAFQAMKTRPGDRMSVERVLSSPTASGAKHVGRSLPLREDWEQIKMDAMCSAVKAKFEQNDDLRVRLLATREAVLVEGNDWGDTFWGVDEKTGVGQNWLGRILMEVRTTLREKETTVVINPPDANNNHDAGLFEGRGVLWRYDLLPGGRPFCSVVGDRHGQTFDLRIAGNDYKFLIGCFREEVSRPDGKTIVKTTNTGYREDAVVEGATSYKDDKGIPAYRLPDLMVEGKLDADRIRKRVLNPLLKAWDDRVNPPVSAPVSVQSSDSALEQIEQLAGTAGPGTDASVASEIAKLVTCGCSEYQAQKMVDAGITDARLRAGSVSKEELLALPKFGEGKVSAILGRYAEIHRKLNPEPDKGAAGVPTVRQEAERIVREAVQQPADSSEQTSERPSEALDASLNAVAGLDLTRHIVQPSPSVEGYTLFLDCAPVGERVRSLDDVLRPYLRLVSEKANVSDISMLEAFRWPGLLNQELYSSVPTFGDICVDTSTKEWDAVRRFFLDRSVRTIRRF